MTNANRSGVGQLLAQARSLHQQGILDVAGALYEDVLEKDSKNVHALHMLGVLRCQQGLTEQGAELMSRAVRIGRKSPPELWVNLGNAYHTLGRPADALQCFDEAITLKPELAQAHYNRGNVLRDVKRREESLASYDEAIALKGDYVEAYVNRGVVLRDLKRYEEALGSYNKAVALNPGDVEAHYNRGNAFRDLNRHSDALSSYATTIALKPGYAEAHNNLGVVFHRINRYDEALKSFDTAISIKPALAEAHNNRANTLADLGRYDEAQASYTKAVVLDPEFAEAQWNQALLNLLLGNFEKGWPQYEWRWKRDEAPIRRHAEQPLWLGGDSIGGKTILVYAEQGLGDTLQFCRYVPLVNAMGAKVLLEVQPSLKPLMHSLDGVAGLSTPGGAASSFDYQCPLLSLPLAFKTALNTIPRRTPYLRADPVKVESWDQETRGLGFKVGIACSGNPLRKYDHNRSIPLRFFAPLLGLGATLFFVQTDCRAEDEVFLRAHPDIRDLRPRLLDFGETAAALTCMDVVISVDTSVAHLAGALGKTVWVLLGINAGWRWLLEREDSPWYPTARLFRQDRIDEWESVIAAVQKELRFAVAGHL